MQTAGSLPRKDSPESLPVGEYVGLPLGICYTYVGQIVHGCDDLLAPQPTQANMRRQMSALLDNIGGAWHGPGFLSEERSETESVGSSSQRVGASFFPLRQSNQRICVRAVVLKLRDESF